MDTDTTHDQKTARPPQQYGLGMTARPIPPLPTTVSTKTTYSFTTNPTVKIYRFDKAPDELLSVVGKIAPTTNPLDTFHHLALKEGIIIHILTSSPEPIHLKSALVDTAHVQHLLVVVEPHARCTIIDEQRSGLTSTFSSHQSEVLAKEGAIVNVITIRELDPATFQTSRQAGRCERNAQIHWHSFEKSSGQSRRRTLIRLEGEDANATSRNCIIGTGLHHSDRKTVISHHTHHSKSKILSRHLLLDSSSAIHRGFVLIQPGQRGCSGHQQDDTLLGSDEARIDAIPTLEIANQDVQCTHAATVRTIDDEDLFYLMSRGISLGESRKSLFEAFLMPLLDALPQEAEDIKQSLSDQLSKEVQHV